MKDNKKNKAEAAAKAEESTSSIWPMRLEKIFRSRLYSLGGRALTRRI